MNRANGVINKNKGLFASGDSPLFPFVELLPDFYTIVREEYIIVRLIAAIAGETDVFAVAQGDVMTDTFYRGIKWIRTTIFKTVVRNCHTACSRYIDPACAAVEKTVVVDGEIRVNPCWIISTPCIVACLHDDRTEIGTGVEKSTFLKGTIPDFHIVTRSDFIPDFDIR